MKSIIQTFFINTIGTFIKNPSLKHFSLIIIFVLLIFNSKQKILTLANNFYVEQYPSNQNSKAIIKDNSSMQWFFIVGNHTSPTP